MGTNTGLVPTQKALTDKVNNVRGLLNRLKPEIMQALPKHITPDRMVRVAMNAFTTDPKLLMCTNQSLIKSILFCSQIGLEPNTPLGEAYLIPFENRKKGTVEVQIIIGFQGLMKLAWNSGTVGNIYAVAVYANDDFSYNLGTDPKIHHIPCDNGERGDLKFAYAVASFKDVSMKPAFIVVNPSDIARAKLSSSSAKSEYSPWKSDPEAMWKKTAIRRLCKYLPKSIEDVNLMRAIAVDEAQEVGADTPSELAEAIFEDDVENEFAEPSKSAKITEKIKGENGKPDEALPFN